MQIKEFLFQKKEDRNSFVESFIFEPEHFNEKNLGNLIILGKIKNTSPFNFFLLNRFGGEIKRKYYSFFKKNPLFALKQSSKKAKDFLENFEERKIPRFNLNIFLGSFFGKKIYFYWFG